MDVKNEQALLGGLLLDAKDFPDAAAQLREDDFAIETDRAIWRAMLHLSQSGEVIDPITVKEACRRSGVVIENDYLLQLMTIVTTAAHVPAYIQAVKTDSMRRKLLELGEQLQTEALTSDPLELSNAARGALEAVSDRATGSGLASFAEVLVDFLDYRAAVELGKKVTVPTGIEGLDQIYGGGLVYSGLHIVAARPGVGKTAVALNIAANVARRSNPVLFVSLEMSRNQLTPRILARFSGVNSSFLACAGQYGEDKWERVAEAWAVLSELPLTICDRDNVNLAYIEAAARSIKGLSLLVVDYLGLLPGTSPRQSIYERVTDNSRGLKQLALRLNIPILCLCQLNREATRNQRPTMADLRDSGHVEQDADTILLLSRSEEQSDDTADYLEADVVKNRHGRTGRAGLWFNKALCDVQ